jgi:hypothetical protein
MKANKSIIINISVFLLMLMVSGCAAMSDSRSYGSTSAVESSLNVATILRFDDVPVPSGFKSIEHESFAFQNDVTRVALLKYVGTRNIDQIVAFYKEQMPLYKWNPINIIEYERRILNFEKESESCIISIEAIGRKNIVTIAISPKSRPMKVEIKK